MPSHFAHQGLFKSEWLHRIAICVALVLSLAPYCRAQISPPSNTTSTPYSGAGHDYIHAPLETVNPANGSVSIRIPVRVPAGRGLTIPFSFAYDSNGTDYLTTATAGGINTIVFHQDSSVLSSGGWSDSVPQLSVTGGAEYTVPGTQGQTQSCASLINYVFQDERGNRHDLALSIVGIAADGGDVGGTCASGSHANFTQGGEDSILATTTAPSNSGIDANLILNTVPVTFGDGTVYNFQGITQFSDTPLPGETVTWMPNTITDRNGNQIAIRQGVTPTGGFATFTYTDTVGRTVLSDSGFGQNPETISVAGLTSPYTLAWTTVQSSFSSSITNLYTGPNASCPNPLHGVGGGNVISSITLPNTQKFTFSYDSLSGNVNKITYPSGGYVRYVWGMNTQSEASVFPDVLTCEPRYDTPAITDRYVSFDGVHEVLHQNFQYSTTWDSTNTNQWDSKQTIVTTTDLVRNTSFQTTYSYLPWLVFRDPNTGTGPDTQIPVENTITYDDTNGALLRTVTKVWDNPRLMAAEQVTLPNGQSSLSVFCYGSNAELTEKDDYDFGNGTPSPASCANGYSRVAALRAGDMLRKAVTSYATFANVHIVDRPSSVTVYDGAGNKVAETDTLYDQSGLQPTTSIVQHVTPAGGTVRGNPTTITKQCFVGSTACTSGNSTTAYTYYDTGQIYQETDPCGKGTCSDMPSGASHTTTFSYTDSYSSCGGSAPPSGASNAYLTQVTHPQTNGINHVESYCYDYPTDLKLASTDENGQTVKSKYSDSLDRLTETDAPDGGQTTISYNDAAPTPSVSVSKKLDTTGRFVSTTMIMNGMGLTTETELTSDPQGTDYTFSTYDGLGLLHTVTNPYRSGGTPYLTTYDYDALGRTIKVTKQDGSVVQTQYNGNSTTVTDESGNQRESFADAFGRLTQVDEPGPGTTQTTASAGTGSVTINGSAQQSGGTQSTAAIDVTGSCNTNCGSGTVYITINGIMGSADYSNTLSSIASAVAEAANSTGLVNASSRNVTSGVWEADLTSIASGSGTNYSLECDGPSNITRCPGSMSGGKDGSYESGTITVTIDGTGYTASYSGNEAGTTLASALASTINSGALVSASASGTTITLTAKATGAGTNYSLSSSYTYSSGFSSPAFTAGPSGSTLTGGANAGAAAFSLTTPYQTTYTYDTLNNLVGILQGGRQLCQIQVNGVATWESRCFTYDSLSHLLTSNNPEAGSVTYAYDLNGNAATKKDARGITITYSFDALNRSLGMTYSNGDPSVVYSYDQSSANGLSITNGIGRRTSMTDAAGSEAWSYDSMGRELTDKRTTNSITKTTRHTYLPFVDGSLYQLTYPSGRTITYGYNSAGQPLSAVDTANSINYATGTLYAPQGALAQMQNGSNLVTTSIYNSRLQPCWTYATTGTALPTTDSCTTGDPGAGNILDLQYAYSLGTRDNGNVAVITNNHVPTRSQTFVYDALNRIISAQSQGTSGSNCFGFQFSYDEWANLTTTSLLSGYSSCSGTTGFAFAPLSISNFNQITTAGFGYDSSGNLTVDGFNTYAWNADSEVKTADGVNYTYDGDGNRIEKSNGTIYWLGAGGEVLDETDLSGNLKNEYVYFGGKRVAMRDASSGNIYYYVDDHLGSAREMVQAGQTSACFDADFLPYGQEVDYTSTCGSHYKFEGKERDTETGNDDFGARYYRSLVGRWLSPDWSAIPAPVPYANLTNPQTLNLYAMVSDNPETFADLDGHCSDHGQPLACVAISQAEPLELPTEGVGFPGPQVTMDPILRGGSLIVGELDAFADSFTVGQDQQQAVLKVAVIRSDDLSDVGQKAVDTQLETLEKDMAKLGITVDVVSDTTTSLGKAKLQVGALNIVVGTSTDFGRSGTGSGWATSGGQKFAGMKINEYINVGDKSVMTHEVLHFLNGDNRLKVNGKSFWRERRVDWQVFKLNHGFTKGMQNLKNNLGELQP